MRNPADPRRSITIARVLVLLGLVLGVGSSVPMILVGVIAESGAGLGFADRLLLSVPLAVAAGLLVGGGNHGLRAQERAGITERNGHRKLFVAGVMIGALAGMVALLFLIG